MKITKTMQDLLDRAQTNKSRPNISSVETAWGRGSGGGKINHGNREASALRKLVEMGLVEIIAQDTSAIPNNGYTMWVRDVVYKIIQDMPSDADYLAALGPCNK